MALMLNLFSTNISRTSLGIWKLSWSPGRTRKDMLQLYRTGRSTTLKFFPSLFQSNINVLCLINKRRWDIVNKTWHLKDVEGYFTFMYQSNRSFNIPSSRATLRAFEFLGNFCSNSPLPGPKSCSNAPPLVPFQVIKYPHPRANL